MWLRNTEQRIIRVQTIATGHSLICFGQNGQSLQLPIRVTTIFHDATIALDANLCHINCDHRTTDDENELMGTDKLVPILIRDELLDWLE